MEDENLTNLKPEREVDCPHCNGTGKMKLNADVEEVEAYYYGCLGQTGHFWYGTPKRPISRYGKHVENILPEPLLKGVDSYFCPGSVPGQQFERTRPEIEGEAKLTRFDGWTLLSWWDRSVDHRGSSNSNLVVRGKHNFTTMLEVLKAQFPVVFSRRNGKPIVFVEQTTWKPQEK